MRPAQIDIRSENVFWGRQLFHDSLVFLFGKRRAPYYRKFLFVLLRVISWIACYAPRKAIHEIT